MGGGGEKTRKKVGEQREKFFKLKRVSPYGTTFIVPLKIDWTKKGGGGGTRQNLLHKFILIKTKVEINIMILNMQVDFNSFSSEWRSSHTCT